MGEFSAAVFTLIEAFSSGIAIIRSLRHRRKESKSEADSAIKAEESRLSKSLKKNRVDVRCGYEAKLERLGRGFADGDTKAHSSLAAILFRLNAGFVSIIDRFTRGESTRSDYQTLVNLSNASRAEAMKTFEQLSARISQSSESLSTTKPKQKNRSGSKSHKPTPTQSSAVAASCRPRPARSRSAPELSVKLTPLGPATSHGWVRPKGQKSRRRKESDSSPRRRFDRPNPRDSSKVEPVIVTSEQKQVSSPLSITGPGNRMSIMSFASDSTKLGEIPERKRPIADPNNHEYLASTAFPLAPWKRPVKPRSKLMRLFGR